MSHAEARARFDRAIQAAQDQIRIDYAAAMTTFGVDVEQAKLELQAKLESMPQGPAGDVSGDVLSGAIVEHNAKIGADGPLIRAYNERVATAQARFNASVQAAQKTFSMSTCFF